MGGGSLPTCSLLYFNCGLALYYSLGTYLHSLNAHSCVPTLSTALEVDECLQAVVVVILTKSEAAMIRCSLSESGPHYWTVEALRKALNWVVCDNMRRYS